MSSSFIFDTSSQSAIYKSLGVGRVNPPGDNFERDKDCFSIGSRHAYVFTTEDIAQYVNEFDLKGKKIACIGGSGDFAYNAFLHGAALVDAVDVSPVSCFFLELKTVGLAKLGYEDFLNFFATTGNETFGPHSFSYEIYRSLRADLSAEASHFFDQLITPKKRGDYLRPGRMIVDKVKHMSFVKKMNYYLENPIAYQMTQRALKPIPFYPQDIRTFLAGRTNYYDLVHFSNIFAYLPYSKSKDEQSKAIDLALNALKEGGEVLWYTFMRVGFGNVTSADKLGRSVRPHKKYVNVGPKCRQIIGPITYHPDGTYLIKTLQK